MSSYMRRFTAPAPLTSGASAANVASTKGKRPWARRAPPKLMTSSFLGGGASFKAPKAAVRPRSSSGPPSARSSAPSSGGGSLAKRCREVAAAAADGGGDDAASVSTEADAALLAAVAKDAAELDETEVDYEIDYSDVRLGDVEEADERARKRAKIASAPPPSAPPPPADDDASAGGDTVDADDGGGCADDGGYALSGVDALRACATAKVERGSRVLPRATSPFFDRPTAKPAAADGDDATAPSDDATSSDRAEGAEIVPEAAPTAPGAAAAPSAKARAACLEACGPVLKYLTRTRQAAWFLDPVDPVAMGIEHYPTIIARPMDFGTIGARLGGGGYGDADAFAADCRQVFINAMTFNKEPDEPVHAAAAWLSAKFEARYADAVADALYDSDADSESEAGECAEIGRRAKHKFPGFGKTPWTGEVTAGGADTLTIKWAEDPEPSTYARDRAAKWLL